MKKFKLFWSTNLEVGYKVIGTIDLPIVTQPVGYIHLYFSFWVFSSKVAWEIC